MKRLIGVLTVTVVSILIVFTACEKNSVIDTDSQASHETPPLTSLDDVGSNILIEGGGNFERVITAPLVKNDGCKFIVSGTIEFRVNGEVVVIVDFGDGECDNIATKTINGVTTEFELDRKYDEFSDKKRDGKRRLNYERVVVNPLIKIEGCDYIVAGTIEILKDGVVVSVVDFGDGECDNLATETIDGVTTEFELDGKEDRGKGRNDRNRGKDKDRGKKCFELVYPVTYIMPDGSTITIENEEGLIALREWYTENPGTEEKPVLQYPVDIIFETEEGDSTVTINGEEEMKRAWMGCRGEYNHG